MPKKNGGDKRAALTWIGLLLGQVGCLTLALVLGALVAGLWLDSRLDTRPIFTLILVLGSVPVTLYLMFRVVYAGTARLRPKDPERTPATEAEREAEGGKDS